MRCIIMEKFNSDAGIPVNTTAEIWFHGKDTWNISEGGKTIQQPVGIK
jgi:hypothetical protein